MDPITRTCRHARRWLGVLLLAALPLGACSHMRTLIGEEHSALQAEPPRAPRFQSDTADTLFGTYLSARFAGSERDAKQAAAFYAEALRQDPENNVILDHAFLHELSGGEISKAVARAYEIIKRDPDKRLAQLVVALDAFTRARYGEARAHLKAAAVGPFNSLASTLVTAWAFAGEGRSGDAVALLSDTKESGAFNLYYLFHKALILDYAGRADEAQGAYRDVIAAGGGDSLRVVDAYGRLLERTGHGKEASTLYAAYSGAEPMHPLIEAAAARIARGETPAPLIASPKAGVAEVLYGLASALAQDRSIDLPIVYLRLALYADSDCDIAKLLLGDILDAVGRYEDANAIYGDIAKSSPLRKGAEVSRALNLDAMGKTDEAIRRLEALSTADGGNLRALVSLGDLLRNRERYDEAARAYARAIARVPRDEPRYWSLYYARGVAYERAGNWAAAEADLKEALKLQPEEPLVLNYLGYSWIEQGKDLDRALKMIEQAVELRPQDGYIVDSLGWAQFKLGRYKTAVQTLENAVDLRPEDATINAHLGDAYWRVGRTLEARFQWKRALTLGAAGEEAEGLKQKIDFGLGENGAGHSDAVR